MTDLTAAKYENTCTYLRRLPGRGIIVGRGRGGARSEE